MSSKDFHQGMLVALELVAVHDEETMYHDIVNTVDAKKLWKAAEEYDREHLARYGYGPNGWREPQDE